MGWTLLADTTDRQTNKQQTNGRVSVRFVLSVQKSQSRSTAV